MINIPPYYTFLELKWSLLVRVSRFWIVKMNASVGGDTSSIKINNLSPLSMFGFATHSSEFRITAQVSKNRRRSPVIRFRVWDRGGMTWAAERSISSTFPQIISEPRAWDLPWTLLLFSYFSSCPVSGVSQSATSHLNPSEPEPFKMGELGAELRGEWRPMRGQDLCLRPIR